MRKICFFLSVLTSIFASSLIFADARIHHSEIANEFGDGSEMINVRICELSRDPYVPKKEVFSKSFLIKMKRDDSTGQLNLYLTVEDDGILFVKMNKTGFSENEAKVVEALMHFLDPYESRLYNALFECYHSLDRKNWIQTYSGYPYPDIFWLKDIRCVVADENGQAVRKYEIKFNNI